MTEQHPQFPEGWIDLVGKQLHMGDTIVAALTLGRSAELRLGTLVGWTEKEASYGGSVRRTIRVVWHRSSSDASFEVAYPERTRTWAWGPIATGKPTTLDYSHMKHLVVE